MLDARKSAEKNTQEAAVEVGTTSEENQFVFVLNDEGQHVLKRASEVEGESERNINKSLIEEDEEDTTDSVDFMESLWKHETDDEMPCTETDSSTKKIVSDTTKNPNLWNEISNNEDDSHHSGNSISKHLIEREINDEFTSSLWNEKSTEKASDENKKNSVRDFFSMVLSPLENEIPSPSTEMQHLSLSSPVNNHENSSEANDCFPLINNNVNAVQVDDNIVEESCRDNTNISTLQTINEDSLKELLNSITE